METIPDMMKNVSRNIQNTFEELIKLVLRKTLRPILNPLGPNTKVVYNNFLGKYERGFIGSCPEDSINKYNYVLTHDCLGWADDVLTNFRILAKFIKNNALQKSLTNSKSTAFNQKVKLPYLDERGQSNKCCKCKTDSQYKNFLLMLESRSIQNIISNKRPTMPYTSDMTYKDSFRQLENIGKDIIDQTDPCISGSESSKMSTSMLRVKLYNLEQDLANMSVQYPNIFDAYIEMIRLINSVPRSKIVWVINIIAVLSFQTWDQLNNSQKRPYLDILGENFIHSFNSNELITILLQSGSSDIILTASYFYSLLKMLFIVFGYSKLVPFVGEEDPNKSKKLYRDQFRKHLEKYRGAYFRRGDKNSCCSGCDDDGPCDDDTNEPYEMRKSDNEPVDQCVYEFIKLFGDLYPTIIGLMGGTETFPPESIEISYDDIPPTYDNLSSLPEYLWRYNDYSYCKYLIYISSKQLTNALACKINAKTKYLQTI